MTGVDGSALAPSYVVTVVTIVVSDSFSSCVEWLLESYGITVGVSVELVVTPLGSVTVVVVVIVVVPAEMSVTYECVVTTMLVSTVVSIIDLVTVVSTVDSVVVVPSVPYLPVYVVVLVVVVVVKPDGVFASTVLSVLVVLVVELSYR